jgi:hypothetical protein
VEKRYWPRPVPLRLPDEDLEVHVI